MELVRSLNKEYFTHVSISEITIFLLSNNKRLIAYIPPHSTNTICISINFPLKTFKSVLTHEISHLYINLINPNLPEWIKEGLATFVSKQIFTNKINKNDFNFLINNGVPFKKIRWGIAAKHNGYIVAGLFIAYMEKRFGWQKLLKSFSKYHGNKNIIEHLVKCFAESSAVSLVNKFKKEYVK